MTFFGMALLTAIGTIVLAVFAVFTAWYARKAFMKQSQEVGLLLEQNKRDADERRRAQGAHVFFGAPDGDPVSPYVKNASEFPVYNVEVWYLDPGPADRFAGPDSLGNIMPGETRSAERAFLQDYPDGVLLENMYLTFTDAAGLDWIRTPDGILSERRLPTPRDEVADITRPTEQA